MSRYFTEDHEWIDVDGEVGTVGITEYAQQQLGDIVFVEVPEEGKELAKGDDAAKRAGAVRALKFMSEQGVLLALRDESGPAGEQARAAYFELMNPKVVTGVNIPDDKK